MLGSIHDQCVSILANLWNAPRECQTEKPIGTATSGSSEGVMLGCLAMKHRWKNGRRNGSYGCPNIVMSSITHICCRKFARYFDVEPRILPITAERGFVLDPESVREAVDENTSRIAS